MKTAVFHEEKATAMACFFLERAAGKKLNDIKLMKLMYIAERRALELYASPIAGDNYLSMEHGPVLETTLQLMRDERLGEIWDRHVSDMERFHSGGSQDVKLIEPISAAEVLSRAEVGVLEGVWDEFGHLTKWKLRDYCHDHFKEYDVRAEQLKTSIPLELETIFSALGDTEDVARAKAADVAYYESIPL